jgi:hypothetical protein
MAIAVDEMEELLAAKLAVVLPHLDERQRRLLLGAEARVLGHGGIRLVAKAAGVGENMVSRGVSEVDSGVAPLGRVRRPGCGRAHHLRRAEQPARTGVSRLGCPRLRPIPAGGGTAGRCPGRRSRWFRVDAGLR